MVGAAVANAPWQVGHLQGHRQTLRQRNPTRTWQCLFPTFVTALHVRIQTSGFLEPSTAFPGGFCCRSHCAGFIRDCTTIIDPGVRREIAIRNFFHPWQDFGEKTYLFHFKSGLLSSYLFELSPHRQSLGIPLVSVSQRRAAVKMTDNKGPMIIAVCWTFTCLALLFVSARLYVRAAIHKKLMSDDYLIIFSSVCTRLC